MTHAFVEQPLCRRASCFFTLIVPSDGHRHFAWPDAYGTLHDEAAAIPGSPNAMSTRYGHVQLWAMTCGRPNA